MKKTLLFLSVLAFTSSIFSQTQLPNSGFENWGTFTFEGTTYEDLSDGWASEFCFGVEGSSTCQTSAKKSTDARTGDFAAEVTADGFFTALVDHPFTERPSGIEFYLKESLINGELGSFSLFLTEDSLFGENSLEVDPVAVLDIEGTNSAYTKYFLPLTFESNQVVNFVSVIFSLDAEREGASYLVDDLNLIYELTALDDEVISQLVYPTVIENRLNIDPSIQGYTLYNSTGKILKQGTDHEVNTLDLSQGYYFIQLESKDQLTYTAKIVKY